MELVSFPNCGQWQEGDFSFGARLFAHLDSLSFLRKKGRLCGYKTRQRDVSTGTYVSPLCISDFCTAEMKKAVENQQLRSKSGGEIGI